MSDIKLKIWNRPLIFSGNGNRTNSPLRGCVSGICQQHLTRRPLPGITGGMRRGLRITLGFLILLPLAGAAIYFAGRYRINIPITSHADFGQTPTQCAAAYGPATTATTDRKLVSPKTLGYVRGGLSIMVGFDESDHAEQFIFSKANLIGKHPLSAAEQKTLLKAFGGGDDWVPQDDNGDGPNWLRADGAGAGYIKDSGWLLLMSKQGLERQIRALNPR